ncbi:MAG: D-glycero-beta-D-manno-heptose 1,7-bisphosphate 7-phosphatase [Gammaproteobacteria bacterium]|nr:D-glycero-beta-D-manno-heptose 1,7-bisphosphate 7-phosphatase [Gammaproteobacteria bacterium]
MATLILLDRDGVVNFDSKDYIKSAEEWEPIPGSLEAMAALKNAGYRVAVCTNQAGIGRGIFTLEDLTTIHDKLKNALSSLGGDLDGLAFCPHHPDDKCRCRKPEPGMLVDMMANLNTTAADTIFVGDSLKDVEAARAAGCEAVLVRTGNGKSAEPEAVALGARVFDDLGAFSRAVLKKLK